MDYADRERRERYVRIQLQKIIARTRSFLKEDHVREVEEFIEHYEFGCAFDLLVATIAIEKAPITRETLDRIHDLVDYMGLEAVTRLDELKATDS